MIRVILFGFLGLIIGAGFGLGSYLFEQGGHDYVAGLRQVGIAYGIIGLFLGLIAGVLFINLGSFRKIFAYERRVNYELAPCAWCHETGTNFLIFPCRVCKGNGSVLAIAKPRRCAWCSGTGREFFFLRCRVCDGSGWAYAHADEEGFY